MWGRAKVWKFLNDLTHLWVSCFQLIIYKAGPELPNCSEEDVCHEIRILAKMFGVKDNMKSSASRGNLGDVAGLPEHEKIRLESLPNELLVKIFSYLPTKDLLQNVALVSKRFYDLSKDSGAHVVVQLPRRNVRSGKIKKFLVGKNHIESVDMAFNFFEREECIQIFCFCVQIAYRWFKCFFPVFIWIFKVIHSISFSKDYGTYQ